MKLTGVSYDIDGLEEYTCEITDAIVTDSRIAIDWLEDGEPFHALLHSSDGGTSYLGTFGSPRPERDCPIEAMRFTARSGEVLLWVKWQRNDNGHGGVCIMHLATEWEE